MNNKEYNSVEICPVCGAKLEKIDDMNYITLICPKCHSTIFEELNGTLHIIKYGIAKDGYNVSMDIFYKQLLAHQMQLSGMFGMMNPGEIFMSRILKLGIYNEYIYKHFTPMMRDFEIQRPYIYFDGYDKYLKMSEKYTKETFPWFFN